MSAVAVRHPTEVKKYTVSVPNEYGGPNDPRMVSMNRTEPILVTCDLCDGFGSLDKEPVPVTRAIGWRRS
jgi:hypothetical protein